jgi:putative FmdB family regulatory protein
MPFYEYSCSACGYEFEAFQSIKDEPLTNCDKCGKPTLQKLISASGFRLKGSGWYETDFKKGTDKKKNLAGSDTSEASTTVKTSTTVTPSADTSSATPVTKSKSTD